MTDLTPDKFVVLARAMHPASFVRLNANEAGALADALDAARAETERLRVHLDDATRSRGDWAAAELAQRGRAERAEAALAALRQRIEGLADDLERPDPSTLAVKRVVAGRLRAALAAAHSDPKENGDD